MEQRKKREIEYYDKKAEREIAQGRPARYYEGSLKSVKFLKKTAKRIIEGKKVLDYGCRTGVHSGWLAETAGKVVAIDLSEKSLEIAKKIVKNVEFLKMDAENLEFGQESFDVVFDGGTFSSLDLTKAFSEITRVLRPGGVLIGIETFAHNPAANLRRKFNKKTGKRTQWSVEHIFNQQGIELAKNYFSETNVYYFHIISWLAFPLLRYPGGKIIVKILEVLDYILMPFFKKYSFKIVFVFKK